MLDRLLLVLCIVAVFGLVFRCLLETAWVARLFEKRPVGRGYIELTWQTEPLFEAVYGHVSPGEFKQITDSYGMEFDPASDRVSHSYARWIAPGHAEVDRTIQLCDQDPGTFPVTVWHAGRAV